MYQHWAEADQSEQYREADHSLSDWGKAEWTLPLVVLHRYICVALYLHLDQSQDKGNRQVVLCRKYSEWSPAFAWSPLAWEITKDLCGWGGVGCGVFGCVCSMRRVNEAVAVGGQVPYQMQMGKLWTASHSGIFTDSTESSRKFLCVCAHKCAHMNTQCINACHT